MELSSLTFGVHAQRELQYLGVSVCLLSHISPHGASVHPENAVTHSVGKGQNICGDLPEATAFKSYVATHEQRSQYANFLTYPRSAFSA